MTILYLPYLPASRPTVAQQADYLARLQATRTRQQDMSTVGHSAGYVADVATQLAHTDATIRTIEESIS